MTKTTSFALAILLVTSTLLTAQHTSAAPAQPCTGTAAGVYVSWGQAGFDPCHTSYNPHEHILSPSNVASLAEGWELSLTGYVNRHLIVANGLLYLTANDGYVYAYSVATRALTWKYNIGSQNMPTVATAAKGVLYVGSLTAGALYALNAANGVLLWKYQTNGYIEPSPTVVNGVVYFGDDDHYVYALNASTGALVWKYLTGDEVTSAPAVANGVVYAASGDGYLYALDANSGALLWTFLVGQQYPSPTPVVANGTVYVVVAGGGVDHSLAALDATSGLLVWRYEGGFQSTPSVANNIAYVATPQGTLYAVDANNGTFLWKFTLGTFPMPQVAVANGVAYVGGADTRLVALNAETGAQLWNYNTIGIAGPPAVINGTVFVGTSAETVYEFRLPSQE